MCVHMCTLMQNSKIPIGSAIFKFPLCLSKIQPQVYVSVKVCVYMCGNVIRGTATYHWHQMVLNYRIEGYWEGTAVAVVATE